MTAAPAAARRTAITIVLTLAVVFAGLLGGVQPARAVSTGVVISQVYGGGGNSGAPYTHDFIELFNRGTTPVALNGWSVQYASATGTGNFGATAAQITELPNATLAPGQYFLIQEASQAAVGSPLPAADVVDGTPISMSASAGKVALASIATSLGCNGGSTPCSAAQLAQIVDLVGYDGANYFEGTGPAPTLSNTTAAIRNNSGCAETDNNAADFATATPAPRNTTSPLNPCGSGDTAPTVSSTSPAGGATNVAVNADITVTFGEPVDVAGTWYSISCTTSGAHTASASGGPTAFTLNPDGDFANSESCTVTVIASQVTDQDTNDPPDAMATDYNWSFTTVNAAVTRIHDIQGAAHTSPRVGEAVSNVPGVVTHTRSNGFYLQDPNPDADDATSEAIFVFTSSAPAVVPGDSLLVGGTVSEFRPGGASSTNLTTTELTGPTIVTVSSGNTLPAPIILGTGGRAIPTTVIEDDAAGSVETSGTFDPTTDGLDFYESLEGMLVRVNDAVAVGPTSVFGSGASQNREIPVLADIGAAAGLRTPRGGIVIQPGDFNPERIILNDATGKLTLPAVDVGATFPGAIVGVIDYSFGNFKLQVAQVPGRAGGVAPQVVPGAGPGQLAVATFNVENLDPGDGPDKFNRLAGLIVGNLRSPDIVALEEIQDNNGATNDSVVDASQTYQTLINAIAAAGGPSYAYRQINPVDDQDGGEPGGNIRVAFLYRTDRGLAFVDRPGGCPTCAVGVTGSGPATRLTTSPGRIDPTNSAFTNSRKPLVGEFAYNGGSLFVVANHFNSKGGDQPLLSRASLRPPA